MCLFIKLIKIFNIVVFIFNIALIVQLYDDKIKTSQKYQQLKKYQRTIHNLQNQKKFLIVEKEIQLRHERIEKYAQQWLGLQPIKLKQIIKLKKINNNQKQNTIKDLINIK